MMEEKYLIDANILITPYESYYPFDLAPSFWRQLDPILQHPQVAILDVAKDEVLKGEDHLSNWIKSLSGLNVCSRKDGQVTSKYGEILTYLQNSKVYNEKAVREWSRNEVADGWLIAAASTYNYIIVTFEKHLPLGALNEKNPCGKPKIPDVADQFRVHYIDLFEFMRRFSFIL